MEQIDATTHIYQSLVDHWPLVVAYLGSLWWLKKNVLGDVLKSVLSNGGGDIIRRIVSEENGKQATDWNRTLQAHETREEERFRSIEERLTRRRK